MSFLKTCVESPSAAEHAYISPQTALLKRDSQTCKGRQEEKVIPASYRHLK